MSMMTRNVIRSVVVTEFDFQRTTLQVAEGLVRLPSTKQDTLLLTLNPRVPIGNRNMQKCSSRLAYYCKRLTNIADC